MRYSKEHQAFDEAEHAYEKAVRDWLVAAPPRVAEITREHFPFAVKLTYFVERNEEWLLLPEGLCVTDEDGTEHALGSPEFEPDASKWEAYEADVIGILERTILLDGSEPGESYEITITLPN